MAHKDRFTRLVDAQIKTSFEKVSRYAITLGIISGLMLFVMERVFGVQGVTVPMMWIFISCLFAFWAYKVSQGGDFTAFKKYIVVFGYVSLPTVLYILSFFFIPSKSATYISGASSHLYFFLIILTGFFMDFRLSVFAGIIAAVEYFASYMGAREYLYTLNSPYTLMVSNMVSWGYYMLKALLMVFAGIVVGFFPLYIREYILQILNMEHEKIYLKKLFGTFLDEKVIDRVTESGSSSGQIAEVAVLFADIRSFTSLCERYEPKLLVGYLNEYFKIVVDAVAASGGIVDKFIGDAVLAVFGGLEEIENPSLSAVEAAYEIVERLKIFRGASGELFSIGIGIDYGKVLQGVIGSPDRKEFTVIGSTVNNAARIEGMTKSAGSDIVISKSVYDMLPDDEKTRFTFLEETAVKGGKDKITVYSNKAVCR